MDKKICSKSIDLELGYKQASVVKNINYTLYYNQIMAVSGESGSGKSTFLKYLRGDPRISRFGGKLFINKSGELSEASKK